MMESPEEASEMACPMVLQAVVGDKQLLLSFPFTPSTYHVVLARTGGTVASDTRAAIHISFLDFIFSSSIIGIDGLV
jgi:hypothetical protein